MTTILFLFVALPAFTVGFWIAVKYLDEKAQPVKQSYPSAVNDKLQLDYDIIKSL